MLGGNTAIATVGIDVQDSFHVVGLDQRGAIVLRQRWSRGQVEARFANIPQCLIGIEACVGADHLSRKLKDLGHDARLMPAKCARPYLKGQKNDFRYTEAVAEAVQRPTMKLVAATRPEGAAPGALARRLAEIMHRIWVDGTEFSGPERPLWHARRTRPHALGEH